MIEGVTPILRVDDLERSRRFYRDVLGFNVDWDASPVIGVSRDRCGIMLCEGAQGQRGTWVWIGVDDARTLHDEFVAKGASIRMPPTNFPWAYEFQAEDPDGHVLRFGSDPADEPFGQFKD